MSKIEVQHIPVVKVNKISSGDLHTKLRITFPNIPLDLEDGWYFYPSWDDWGKVLNHVQGKMRRYVPDAFDCDNFARYVSVMCAYYFEVNTCGIAEGPTYLGQHKWNVIFDGDSFTQLESQNKKEFFEPDDDRYTPQELLFG